MIVKVNTRHALNKAYEKLENLIEGGTDSFDLRIAICMLENHTEPTIDMTYDDVVKYIFIETT